MTFDAADGTCEYRSWWEKEWEERVLSAPGAKERVMEMESEMRRIHDTAALVDERGAQYGHPAQNLRAIGGMWQVLIDLDPVITPERQALMMIVLKVAREWFGHDDDHLADIEGYVECIRRIRETQDSLVD